LQAHTSCFIRAEERPVFPALKKHYIPFCRKKKLFSRFSGERPLSLGECAVKQSHCKLEKKTVNRHKSLQKQEKLWKKGAH